MKKLNELYRKSEIVFAVLWIVAYVVLSSVADTVSQQIGLQKSATLAVHLVLSGALLLWLGRNNLWDKYGFRAPDYPASRFLFYIPLVIVASSGLWNGIDVPGAPAETACRFLSMLCVGFLEEVIFRGLLFRAMAKNNMRQAVIVSSVTFGLGHIVNLLNGKPLGDTLIQIIFAVAVGFVLVLIVHRGGSIIPCVVFHSLNNALRVFSAESRLTLQAELAVSLAMTVALGVGYALWLLKALPTRERT